MATTWTELRDRIRQRSDNEYTDGKYATDDEILVLANRSQKALFGLLAEAGLHSLTETIYTVPVDGSLNYALPDACFVVAGVFRLESGSYIRLDRHDQRAHPRDTEESVAWSYRTHGRLEDSVIEFNPRVSSGTYKVRYLGVPVDIALDADTIDGVLGWEEWIVLDVAIDLLSKEKIWEAVEHMQGRQDRITQRIEAQASQRDMTENAQIQNVRGGQRDSLFDDQGYLPGGNRGIRGYWGTF